MRCGSRPAERAFTRVCPPARPAGGCSGQRCALHEAVLYSAPGELARRLVPRLRSSLEDGGPVVAVLDEPTRAEVRRALGGEADRVKLPDPAAVHRFPPFTVTVRWARLSRRAGTTGRATVVGQLMERDPDS